MKPLRRTIPYAAIRCISVPILAACAGLWATSIVPAQTPCQNPPAIDVNTPAMPIDVCIPDGFGGLPIAFFDDFSWRSFVAMVWPVKAGERGVPDQSKKVSDPGTRVFETFKADWEVFRPNGAEPLEWNMREMSTPCGNTPAQFDDVVLASFSKFGNLGEA